MKKKTVFIVTDIETTYRERIAFDIAWKAIDRQGNVYGKGSYLAVEAFTVDVPFFKEKLGWYFQDTYAHYIEPLPFLEIRTRFNNLIKELKDEGYRVVLCAYNAAFDTTYLGLTSQKISNIRFLDYPVELLDIWHFWCMHAPLCYNIKTEKGNPKTKAETVYAFEFDKPDFIERHIAFADVDIESELLLKLLEKRKQMPIVSHPSQFTGQPWRLLLNYPAYITQPRDVVDVEIGEQPSLILDQV